MDKQNKQNVDILGLTALLYSSRMDTERQLMDAGFIQDHFGQYVYTDDSGLKIILYKVDEWEVDLTLPNGVTIGVDASTLTINTNQKQEVA